MVWRQQAALVVGQAGMDKRQGRGGIGSHKHGVSGRSGPPSAVKRATATFFNRELEQEADQRQRRTGPMFATVHQALEYARAMSRSGSPPRG
jgi:hypothetical protein